MQNVCVDMKAKIYLHIGIGKTGTTSIQDYLFSNRFELKEKGILYPEVGLRGTGRHDLAKLDNKRIGEKEQSLYRKLIEEIDSSGCHKIIISSENFAFLKEDYVKEVAWFFKSYDVKLIFYVRNQVPLIQSTFLEWQKVNKNYLETIEKFFTVHHDGFDFLQRVKFYIEAFDKENIITRVFDKRNIGKDVRADFSRLIGIGVDISKANEDSNTSLLTEFSKIVSLIDKAGIDSSGRRLIINGLLAISNKFRPLSTSCLIDTKLKNRIIKRYKKSNNFFADKFLDDYQKRMLLEV